VQEFGFQCVENSSRPAPTELEIIFIAFLSIGRAHGAGLAISQVVIWTSFMPCLRAILPLGLADPAKESESQPAIPPTTKGNLMPHLKLLTMWAPSQKKLLNPFLIFAD
jgi:hypothetical protein